MKTFLAILLLGVVYVKKAAQEPSEEKLQISVYYESLCSGCVSFITDELYPAYQKIGSSLEVDLVPYGNTRRFKINDKWAYRCQNSFAECFANVLQACGLARISDQGEQLKYVSCVLQSPRNVRKVVKCVSKAGLDVNEVYHCGLGPEGVELYGKLADKQESLDPAPKYAPWIVINGKFNETLEFQALDNFLETACSLLDNKPSGCDKADV